jgi:GT2 family glycosyltransferase
MTRSESVRTTSPFATSARRGGPAGIVGLEPSPAVQPSQRARPTVRGKFLQVGDEKLWVKGVTYGTFRPNADAENFPERTVVSHDLEQMAANGLTALRTYTVPPRWLLDEAERHGLRVMVGLPWEQHIAFLDNATRAAVIEERVRAGVRACAGHPAVLCYAVGNEIPSPIVRWHGRRRIERFLERLYRAAKAEDPGGLVTYVNYPTTEYLDLSFLDLVCFNVYLEAPESYRDYLARLHNLAGDRPLIMGEVGLDSRRNGEGAQARAIDWQVRAALASGCSGAFVFAWTDEWHRGGFDIDDWDFGLTDRERRPKPALAAVREAFAEAPFPKDRPWPSISVVVCSYNGARTIRDTCEALRRVDYPDFEVIVVDDGSTDGAGDIARRYGFRVISTSNRGLSSARNTGWNAAAGEIVAYIDDDAYPDPHWLTYLAATFEDTDHVGVGGPNLPPPGDGPIAECIANAPGGPVHVLLSDHVAEHIPGCNMAFRRSALEAIGGFDVRYRAAGDDVDVCWRLQHRGWTIGFHPAAIVWHHRRNSVRTYWKQQIGYGRAEALLERKWPGKYNAWGHLTWLGRLYGRGLTMALPFGRGRVYQGTWGLAPFQALYQPSPATLASLPLMPEWYLVILGLALLSAIGVAWRPLLVAIPLLATSIALCLTQAVVSSARATFPEVAGRGRALVKRHALTAVLHLLQPLARLTGRLRHGLTPWRLRWGQEARLPRARVVTAWRETWRGPSETLRAVQSAVHRTGLPVRQGGDFDAWDLWARAGMLGGARVFMAIEEHGAGRQLLRFRCTPRVASWSVLLVAFFTMLALLAALDRAWLATGLLEATALLLTYRALAECVAAESCVVEALRDLGAISDAGLPDRGRARAGRAA